MEHVVKTNEKGMPLGTMEKKEAHMGSGVLHSALSVFVFRNGRSELLIQKRSPKKMLFGGLWANTCCSHPREGEDIVKAGERRLREECGFDLPLTAVCSFVYKAEDPLGNGSEHEYDTILIGDLETDTTLNPNPEEIAELQWMALEDIQDDLALHPEKYAPWFPLALEKIFS